MIESRVKQSGIDECVRSALIKIEQQQLRRWRQWEIGTENRGNKLGNNYTAMALRRGKEREELSPQS